MLMKAFALLDTKAQYFGQPFFCQSTGEAIRACMETAQDMRSTVARYPTDFTLYEIGHYDNQTAMFTATNPQSLGVVANFLPTPKPLPLEVAADLRDAAE